MVLNLIHDANNLIKVDSSWVIKKIWLYSTITLCKVVSVVVRFQSEKMSKALVLAASVRTIASSYESEMRNNHYRLLTTWLHNNKNIANFTSIFNWCIAKEHKWEFILDLFFLIMSCIFPFFFSPVECPNMHYFILNVKDERKYCEKIYKNRGTAKWKYRIRVRHILYLFMDWEEFNLIKQS